MSTRVRALFQLFLFVVLSITADMARAVDVPPLVRYVNDSANLLSDTARERLDSQLAQFHAAKGPQLVVLTVPDLQGVTVEEFALKVATTWQLGDAKRDDGMLLLVAKQERRVRIEVGYGLEGQIPDAAAARIIRSFMTPALKRGDYDLAVESACNALIAHAATPSVPAAQARALQKPAHTATRSESLSFMAVVRWFIAIFFGLSFLAGIFRKRSPGESTSVSFSSTSSPRESSVVSSNSGDSGSVSGGGGGFGGGGASGSW